MLNFSYMLSPTTLHELKRIDETRNKILLELIEPRLEIKLRFVNTIDLIEKSLFLSGKAVSKKEIMQVMAGDTKSPLAVDILEVKNSYDYIRESWLLMQEPINQEAIGKLIKLLHLDRKVSDDQTRDISKFINVNPEHPLVQASLAFILTASVIPQNNDSIKVSTILSNLFVYDHGYDCRGFLNLQEHFASDLLSVQEKMRTALSSRNLSDFIEYYILAFSLASEKALDKIKLGKINKKKHITLFNLTSRQGRILSLFTIPDIKITNKNIQQEFGVSQITASRDLSQLSTLGLIFRKGRGRSVYYTK